MSLSSFISDIYNSLTVSDVQAEAPPAEERGEPEPKEESKVKEEEPEGEEESVKEKAEEEEAETEGKGEGEEKEEEEEEEEPEDPAIAIVEECTNTKECKPYKHHYDECVERVTSAASEDDSNGPKEDCVEEFFHVLHCANACAAPRLWSKLK